MKTEWCYHDSLLFGNWNHLVYNGGIRYFKLTRNQLQWFLLNLNLVSTHIIRCKNNSSIHWYHLIYRTTSIFSENVDWKLVIMCHMCDCSFCAYRGLHSEPGLSLDNNKTVSTQNFNYPTFMTLTLLLRRVLHMLYLCSIRFAYQNLARIKYYFIFTWTDEAKIIQPYLSAGRKYPVFQFNFTLRYTDDALSYNHHHLEWNLS